MSRAPRKEHSDEALLTSADMLFEDTLIDWDCSCPRCTVTRNAIKNWRGALQRRNGKVEDAPTEKA